MVVRRSLMIRGFVDRLIHFDDQCGQMKVDAHHANVVSLCWQYLSTSSFDVLAVLPKVQKFSKGFVPCLCHLSYLCRELKCGPHWKLPSSFCLQNLPCNITSAMVASRCIKCANIPYFKSRVSTFSCAPIFPKGFATLMHVWRLTWTQYLH